MISKYKLERLAKKVWYFLWYEESIWSFIADAIIIILVGKFLIYPAIGMALGTQFPVVAVVSDSMTHYGQDFDTWWNNNNDWYVRSNITKTQFQTFYLKDGFNKGDILVIKGQESYQIGDTVVYSVAEKGDPIIHRVVSDSEAIATKGDANPTQLDFETSISSRDIHGEAVFKIPWLGWVKIAFLRFLGLFGL